MNILTKLLKTRDTGKRMYMLGPVETALITGFNPMGFSDISDIREYVTELKIGIVGRYSENEPNGFERVRIDALRMISGKLYEPVAHPLREALYHVDNFGTLGEIKECLERALDAITLKDIKGTPI